VIWSITTGETKLATYQEQASSPKTWHLAQKHDILSHVAMTTFGQNTDSQQQTLILNSSDHVYCKPLIGFSPVMTKLNRTVTLTVTFLLFAFNLRQTYLHNDDVSEIIIVPIGNTTVQPGHATTSIL
jgi:hypothetical protein